MSLIKFSKKEGGGNIIANLPSKNALLSKKYQGARPYPHIILDDFLPVETIQKVLRKFPTNRVLDSFSNKRENKKRTFNPNDLDSDYLKTLFYSLNSKYFLTFLEDLTGIQGLIPDPDFSGGGFHETLDGGHLGIHADFNLHERLHLHRRINVLIYLNDEWLEEYGGNLELWDLDMKNKVKSIAPIMNRCVVFNTDSDSYHGHPDPLSTPNGITRKSIALYYYTSSKAIYSELPQRSTVFKKRPNSADTLNINQTLKNIVKEIIPPVIARYFFNKNR